MEAGMISLCQSLSKWMKLPINISSRLQGHREANHRTMEPKQQFSDLEETYQTFFQLEVGVFQKVLF